VEIKHKFQIIDLFLYLGDFKNHGNCNIMKIKATSRDV